MKKREVIDAEKYFLAIANTTNDMIHLNDSEGRIIFANQATETMLGYPLNEIINTPAFALIHPDDSEIVTDDMRTISADNQLPPRDIRLRKKDGSYLDVEARGFIVALDENKYLGAILRDISERKRTERELEDYRHNLEEMVAERTAKLQNALNEVKRLRGIFPICMFCKQIRDDKGFWNQVDVYLKEHSEADFTHSVCPECAQKHYGNFLPKKK